MKVEDILSKVQAMFGGDGAEPKVSSTLLITWLNEWLRDELSREVSLSRLTPSLAFAGTPANPPGPDDYSMSATTGLRGVFEVTWGNDRKPLARRTYKEIRSLGLAPTRDVGTPTAFWISWGTTPTITTPQFLVHPYPIPNVAGTLYIEAQGLPVDCTAGEDITFPEIFADAAVWELVARWREFDEEYSDQDRDAARAKSVALAGDALRSYNAMVGPEVVRAKMRS